MEILLIAVVLLALFFDFTNGFHDTANAIATSVSTKAVSPKVAVVGAAILNFVGAFVSLKVAATVAKGIVSPASITLHVVLAGIIAATVWNLITWRWGLPTSSSHALIGGVAGAAVVAGGWSVVNWSGLKYKVLIPSLAAPFIGLIAAGLIMVLILWLVRKRTSNGVNHVFRRLQLISGSFVAFTHGTNDAQKTMGIITLALLAGSTDKHFQVPLWVIVSSAVAMGLGTYIGGWRIVNTLGTRLVKLEPPQGFAAETATATILGTTALLGFPVSTTHTISGSIVGAGVADGRSKVQWKVTRDILIAWVLTIPCVGLLAGGFQALTPLPAGTFIATFIALAISIAIVYTRHWTSEEFAAVRARLNFVQWSRTPKRP